MYNIMLDASVQCSDPPFLEIILCLMLLQNNGYVPWAVECIFVAYLFNT